MWIFKSSEQIYNYLREQQNQGRSLGFVPTMGALHQGHLELLKQAQKQHELSVCSIFVNPRQFNDPQDLKHYPRPLEQDLKKLQDLGCDVLFLPEENEIYPADYQAPRFETRGLDLPFEGVFRPGHFLGMLQVVHRLLQIIPAQAIYMGQKDYQQQLLVKQMIAQFDLKTQLVCVPTVRESDGLALSSRNIRLSPQARSLAPLLYQTLEYLAANSPKRPQNLRELCQEQKQKLEELGIEVEYLNIVHPETLEDLGHYRPEQSSLILGLIRLDQTRLLDNLIF